MNDPRQPAAAPAQPIGHPPHAPHPAHPAHPQHAAPGQMPRPSHVQQPMAPRPAGNGAGTIPHAPSAQPQGLPRQAAGSTMNPAAAPLRKPAASDEDSIALVDEDADTSAGAATAPAPSKIKFGAELGHRTHTWKRDLKGGGSGACRVRTFHGKLSDQGLEYVDDAINVWLDAHPEIDVKFVTTNVGLFDGKFKDLALIVNVWY
jgi:hypothetical protein